jgi:hypothetical protein
VKLATLLETTIGLRQSYSNDLSNILEDSDAKRGSDATHASFLNVLKKVQGTLERGLPKGQVSREQPRTPAEIVNLFDHLELEEPSAAFEQAPDIAPAPSTNEPIYKAEGRAPERSRRGFLCLSPAPGRLGQTAYGGVACVG